MAKRIDINPFNAIGGILVLILVFWGLSLAFSLIFKAMAFLAPFLLIGAAIIDFTVITDYAKWIVRMLKENLLLAVGAILLTIFGFPIIAGFLFGKAWLRKKVKTVADQYEEREKGSFVEYEEVDDNFEKLELPPKPVERPTPVRRQKPADDNDYEQLFD